MQQIDEALTGSNMTLGNTDQGSRGDPNYYRGGTGVNINGEGFNDWGVAGSRAYRLNQQAHVHNELMNAAKKGGVFGAGQPQTIKGAASLGITLDGFPRAPRLTSPMAACLRNIPCPVVARWKRASRNNTRAKSMSDEQQLESLTP